MISPLASVCDVMRCQSVGIGRISPTSFHCDTKFIFPKIPLHVIVVIAPKYCRWYIYIYIYIYTYIYIYKESRVLLLLLLCSFMMCANNRIYYGPMVVFVLFLFFVFCILHYLIIIIIPTYLNVLNFSNACQIHYVECVPKRLSILSIIFHAIYWAVRIQLTHFCYGDCENVCSLSYYHHQIRSMTHLPLFRVRSWNNGMHCISFSILISYLYSTRPMRDVVTK